MHVETVSSQLSQDSSTNYELLEVTAEKFTDEWVEQMCARIRAQGRYLTRNVVVGFESELSTP